jgi:hypothetical protein
MYLIWKWSTIILALQAVVGTVAYGLAGVSAALWAAGGVVAVMAGLLGVISRNSVRLDYIIPCLTAFIATIAVVAVDCWILLSRHDAVFVATVCAGFMICLSATLAERTVDETKESVRLTLLGAASWPFGIGTMIGGIVLLRRFYHKRALLQKRQFVEEMNSK